MFKILKILLCVVACFALPRISSADQSIQNIAKEYRSTISETCKRYPISDELVRDILGNNTPVNEANRQLAHEALIIGIIRSEGSGPFEVSSKGAKGIMQTMQSAKDATGIECRESDIKCSIRLGVAYVKILEQSEGKEAHGIKDAELLLLAYNQGPTKALEHSYRTEDNDYVLNGRNYINEAVRVLSNNTFKTENTVHEILKGEVTEEKQNKIPFLVTNEPKKAEPVSVVAEAKLIPKARPVIKEVKKPKMIAKAFVELR